MVEALATAPAEAGSAWDSLFIQELVKQWRAQDTHGTWEGRTNATLLAPYIITREQRREMPILGDPDPETLWRLELFFNAIALAIEKRTKVMVSPMMKMSHEGFGRQVLIAGRLVVVNKQLRDVHRFGFESMEKLAAEGEKYVEMGVDMVNTYHDVANYG